MSDIYIDNTVLTVVRAVYHGQESNATAMLSNN